MSLHNRREFLRDSSLLAAASLSLGQLTYAQDDKKKKEKKIVAKVSPNERIRVAVIGFNGRGMDHIKGFGDLPETEIVMLCDPDSRIVEKGIKGVKEMQEKEPGYVQDLRRIMDDKSIDAVSIATPNHWHALAAIWAIQAGKDVYVEKPVSHNVSEGRRIVEVARKNNKIVQCGTQSRSNEGMQQVMEFLHAGKIGAVKVAYGLCYKPRGSIGITTSPYAVPEKFDYNLWCGPAPMDPVMRTGIHYNWHWFWNTGNGDLGNQGIHEMDKARWGLNLKSLPDAVWSMGGRVGYVDSAETANTQLCIFNYAKEGCRLFFEVRGLKTDDYKGSKIGNIWVGPDGYVVSNSYSAGIAYRPNGEKIVEFKGGGSHYANFVKAVKSRKVSDLTADIEEGHLSSALCHLGNISYRLGHIASPEEMAKTIDNPKSLGMCDEGCDAVARMKKHLEDNKVDLAGKFHIGKPLQLDAANERFKDDKEANAMLTREYRKGFEVPSKA
ncbi:MAG TPA: Gfo/Idh/MocA family oxidoreductase [Gemmatales bacterium]|nr:Gfo/Idh/MocA family oxidoreductase [Gemmatales bacterium]